MLSHLSISRIFLLVFFWAAPLAHAQKWTILNDCELENSTYADGDSFHIHSGSREMIIRLYFVDTPETDSRFPDRLKEQADYFGISVEQALKLGEKAAAFTRQTLSKRFTVVTQYEDARGNSNEPRYYGFVLLEGGRRNFAEMLVVNGLARVFGAPAHRPGGPDSEAQWQQLRRLENTAKAEHLGGWGGGKEPVTTPKISTNDDFFQKAKSLATPPSSPQEATVALPPADAEAIDLNSATLQELESLPKIGKVLAARIVEARPFKMVEQLRDIPGIKEKAYLALLPLVCAKVD